MASASNNVIVGTESMEVDYNGDPSHQSIQENVNPNISKDLEHPLASFTTATQSSTNAPAEISKSNPDDCESMPFSEEDFHEASNILKGTSEDNVEFPSENDSMLKNLDSGLPVDNETIQSTVTQENGSTQVIQLGNSVENGSTKVVQSDMPGETEFLKTESNVSDETRSIKLSQETISSETESTEESSMVNVQTTNLKDAIHPLDSWDFNSKKGALLFSSDTINTYIVSNDSDSSEVLEIPSEEKMDIAIDLLNNVNLDTSRAAKNMDNFGSLLDSEEYRNGTHFLIINQGGGGGGYAIATTSPPCTPIISDLKMPLLSLPTSNTLTESLQPSNPTEDAAFPKDMSSQTSLSTLVSILVDWVNKGLDRAFNRPQKTSVVEFINYADKEFKYELDVLKRLKWRVDTLMRAIEHLPNPHPILPCTTRVQSNSIRDDLNEAGMKVWHILEAMETDATEDYEKFVSRCYKDLTNNEDMNKKLELLALNKISNAYVKASESFSVLRLDIEIFRNKIREFCSEFDKFL